MPAASADDPARFVAEFIDALECDGWAEMGIDRAGNPLGAPADHPRALLSVWVYGFMTGVRSSRKLETACREQLPSLWLTGGQSPDHITRWRFYAAHRAEMQLFTRTVRTTMARHLVDVAVPAVAGPNVGANVADARTYDAAGLRRLLGRVELTIDELEAQNAATAARLSLAFAARRHLQGQVRAAVDTLQDPAAPKADKPDRPRRPANGDAAGPAPGLQRAGGGGDRRAPEPDVGRCGLSLGRGAGGLRASRPARGHAGGAGAGPAAAVSQGPLHLRRGQRHLLLSGRAAVARHPPQAHAGRAHAAVRLCRTFGAVCRACPAFGVCTTDGRPGCGLEIGPPEAVRRQHRAWMATRDAQHQYAQRQHLVEPVFGIIKEQLRARR